MDHNGELPRIEIRNAQGELVEPPEGVSYSGSYRPIGDTGPSDFNPSGAHSCVFCGAPDWHWIVKIGRSEPEADIAWAPHLVSCDTCQRLCRADHLDALRERTFAETGAWMLEYLDDLLDRIIAFIPRMDWFAPVDVLNSTPGAVASDAAQSTFQLLSDQDGPQG